MKQPHRMNRRDFAALTASIGAAPLLKQSLAAATPSSGDLAIAPFRFDVSPPMGHSLCGGWIKPVIGYDDSLEAIGYILKSTGQKPIVICAVD